jgi:hypothetical protein
MDEFESNSKINKPSEPKAERKPLNPVVTGPVIRKKKGLGSKLAETFSGDDAQTVGNYILFEVAVPALKNLIVDMITEGAERAFFPTSSGRRHSSGGSVRRTSGGPAHTNYSSFSRGVEVTRADAPLVSRKRVTDFDMFVISSRPEAEIVLDRLSELIRDFGLATVADLYDLLEIREQHTDRKWGWTDIRGAEIVRDHGGYRLVLPDPKPID